MNIDPKSYYIVPQGQVKGPANKDNSVDIKATQPATKTTNKSSSKIEQTEIEFNSSVTPPESKQRQVLERKTSPGAYFAGSCLKHLLIEKNQSAFNSSVDELKNATQWHGEIEEKVSKLSAKGKNELANLELRDLRDFDREVVGLILKCLASSNKFDETTTAKLKSNIEALETLIINVDEKGPNYKYLGGGAVNSVYKVTAMTSRGEVTGVFKPDPAGADFKVQVKETLFGTAHASGIPAGDEAHLSARSVASSVLDRMLFGEDNPIGVETVYVILNGKRGILMEMAEGAALKTPKMVDSLLESSQYENLRGVDVSKIIARGSIEKEEHTYILGQLAARDVRIENGSLIVTYPEFQKPLVKKELQAGTQEWNDINSLHKKLGDLTPQNMELIKHSFGYADFKVEGEKYFITENPESFNLINPTTSEGLLKLQVFDWISGQVDRHPENYYINFKTNEVIAIDNDCSFGVNSVPDNVDVRRQPSIGGVIPNNASLMLRMPDVVTEDVRLNITQLYNSQDELKSQLKEYISDEEIQATLKRLEHLYNHVHTNALVVPDDQGLISPEARALQNADNSYLEREIHYYRDTKWHESSKWNIIREHHI